MTHVSYLEALAEEVHIMPIMPRQNFEIYVGGDFPVSKWETGSRMSLAYGVTSTWRVFVLLHCQKEETETPRSYLRSF